MTYLVKLTEGNSQGNYNIYYNDITPGVSNLMTVAETSNYASNITLAQLLQGIEVTAPIVPTKVIVYGIECDVAIELTFTTSTPKTIPPIYCFSYLSTIQNTIQFIPGNTLYNGEFQWVSTDGSKNLRWNPYFNGGVGRWEIVVETNLLLVNGLKTNGLPSGNWLFIGSTGSITADELNKSLIVNEGICTPTQNFSCSLTSTPNSCANSKIYDGTITVTVNGGTPPYLYDNGYLETTWPVFNSLAPGNYIIVATDANGNQTSCSTTVGEGDKKTTYQLSLNYLTNDVSSTETTKIKRTTFDLSVQPAIPAGTTVSVTLSFVDLRTVASPGAGNVSNVLEITKNGNTIPTTTNSTTQVNVPRPNCTNYNEIDTTILKTCTFSITNNDVIEGVLSSTVDITSSQVDNTTNCATELENIVNVKIQNPTSNCRCCDISIVNGNQIEIMNNKIVATKKTISSALSVQLAYSQVDCNIACSSTIGVYYRTCFTLIPGCELFTDSTLTNKPPAGYYSDYTYCYYFDGDSIVDSTTCPNLPPDNTIKYYTADVFRCVPFNCSIPIDNIIVTTNSNDTLQQNFYYRDVEYSDFVYRIDKTRGVSGPASRQMDPNSESTDCQACCSFVP